MLDLSKILLPIDFSEQNRIAAQQAGILARYFRSEVTLLHVSELLVLHPFDGPLGFGITGEAQRAEHLGRCEKLLEEFGVTELKEVPVKRLLRCGDPAKLIAEHARELKSDLIFMPTHGHGTFRRLLLGSVTAKVLHDADCPVWTGAHLGEAPTLTPADIRHIMCAVNFGPETHKVIRWATDFASRFGAKVTLVHSVFDTPPSLPDRYMFVWRDETRAGANERLQRLVLDLQIAADVLTVSNGDIPAALSTAAKEKGADLLVIGRSAGDRAKRLGTHTYGIICNVPCPVVSIDVREDHTFPAGQSDGTTG
jgi:nucleotide-binding universal stress UspA family protein